MPRCDAKCSSAKLDLSPTYFDSSLATKLANVPLFVVAIDLGFELFGAADPVRYIYSILI